MNFIEDLDFLLDQEKEKVKTRFGDTSINKYFGVERNLEVSYGNKKYNFLIRKNEKTRFLINENNVKIYLSDFDILKLLIDNFSADSEEMINQLIDFLNNKVKNRSFGEEYKLIISDENSNQEYLITGINLEDTSIHLDNEFDLHNLSLNHLKVLINLILAKDILSKELGDEDTPDYLKRTAYKYIIMLKSVILKDEKIIQIIQQKELCKYNNEEFVVIDTAGMRKKGKIYESVEKYSLLRSMRAIDRSDICLLEVYAEEGIIEQDKHIAGYVLEKGKGLIIVVNKWDKVSDKSIKEYLKIIRNEFQFFSYVPVVFTSALTKKRIHTLMPEILKVSENIKREIKIASFFHAKRN